MTTAFAAGVEAFKSGKSRNDNPHTDGLTKLGNPRLTETGIEWDNGFMFAKPARIADATEMAAAQSVDVSRFRRKSNRYYK